MRRRSVLRRARGRVAKVFVCLMAAMVVLGTPLTAQTTSPTAISIIGGLVCKGGSETYKLKITLPPATVIDKVDVFFLFDDTGSFAGTAPQVISIFGNLVSSLETAMPGVSFGFGVGRFEDYGGSGTGFSGELPAGRPFTLNQPIVTAATAGGAGARDALINAALAATAPGFGGDGPESALEALSQVATGAGFDGNGNASSLDSGPAGAAATQTAPGPSGDVPPFSSNVGTTSGTQGGVGWRSGALHLVILATDICTVAAYSPLAPVPGTITGAGSSVEPSSAFGCAGFGSSRHGYVSDSKSAPGTVAQAVAPLGAATVQDTVSALNALGIRVLGMGPSAAPTGSAGPSGSPSVFLSALARLTGAVDGIGNPLVFDTAVPLATLTTSIVDAITTTTTLPVDITLAATALPAGLSWSFTPLVHTGVAPGATVEFDVTLTGDGTPINGNFDINFTDVNSGAILGTVPVTLACPTCTGPTVVCVPSYNPSGKHIPNASSVNEDGFYLVQAGGDACGTTTLSLGSFTLVSGETIKLTQTPGKAGVKYVGTMGPASVKHFQVGKGDAVITATDSSGNVSSVTCLVPPPPK